MSTRKMRLGDLLLRLDLITEDQLTEALEYQKSRDNIIALGEILLRMNLLSKSQLIPILEHQLGVEYVDLRDIDLQEAAINAVNESMARRYRLIPIQMNADNTIEVGMVDPLNFNAIDDVRILTRMDVLPKLAFDDEVEWAINMNYTMSEVVEAAMEEYAEEQILEGEVEQEEFDSEEVNRAPIVRLVNSILEQAVRMRASDIHIEPQENSVKVRLRVDGDLKEMMTAPRSSLAAIVARVKILSRLDISEKRTPQDGRIEMKINNRPIDFRVSILPTVHGEKVVMRILDRASVMLSKEELGFTEHNEALFDRLMRVPEGVVLISGPTGSGKTTTLYAALQEINKPNINIVTIEDPVEYRLEGVNQVQVNNRAGLTFAGGLRSILRQDPDVVMVGEIRDSETAEISVRSAITGHMVLSTIHTNDTVSTIMRLTDMGIEKFLVASALTGVLAQRLVKRVCLSCKELREATKEEKKAMKMDLEEPLVVAEGKGCNVCGGSGYSGRVAIHEILIIDDEIRSMITSDKPLGEIKRRALEKGLRTLSESCKELVLEEVTTVAEMLRVAYSVDDD